MNNPIFKMMFPGIRLSLAYVGSINDYIESKLWLKPQRYSPTSYHFSLVFIFGLPTFCTVFGDFYASIV